MGSRWVPNCDAAAHATDDTAAEKEEPRVVGTRGSDRVRWLRGGDSNP